MTVDHVTVDLDEILSERDALRAQVAHAREGFAAYRRRLAGLLDADQKEAAQITGCAEDEYAIQLIRLCQMKIDEMKAWRH